MTEVVDSEEFAAVMMQENSGGRRNSNGISEPTMQFVSFSDNSVSVNQDIESASATSVSASGVRSAAEDLSDEDIKKLIPPDLREKYENGDTVVLMYPSPKTINKVLVALGEQPTYVEPEEVADDEDIDAEDLYPEMFAIAKRYNGNSPHTFTYMLPSATSLMKHAAEFDAQEGEESEDVAQEATQPEPVLPEVTDPYEGMRAEYVLQARRYLALRNWSAEIDSVFAAQKAFVASSFKVNAADEASTKIFDYSAQRESSNFDWTCARNNLGHDWNYSRTANTADTIYAFHNFGDECDYYVVQSTGSYYPTGYKRFKDGDWYYTFGAASYFEYRHTLTMDDSYFDLFNNAPRNVNRKSTVTDGSEHSTSATSGQSIGTKTTASVNASLTDGLSASISTELSCERNTSKTNGASYSHSATWETEEWALINKCDSNAAHWRANYDSDYPNCYAEYDGIDSRTRNNAFDCEWMWQVKDPTQTAKMKITLYDSQVKCKMSPTKTGYYGTTEDTTYRYYKIAQPPHVVLTTVSDGTMFDKNAKTNMIFSFLCNHDWTIYTTADWLRVSPEQKTGDNTGASERSIFWELDAFDTGSDTSYHTREGLIIVQDNVTKQVQSLRVTQSNK